MSQSTLHNVQHEEDDRQTDTPRVHKERLTVHLPVDLIEQVKRAVYYTPGLTLAAMAENALKNELERIEAERGEKFPERKVQLKGGRPMK